MTASWLAQMGWDVRVIEGADDIGATEQAKAESAPTRVPTITPGELRLRLNLGPVPILDLASSRHHRAGHIPGALFARRDDLAAALASPRFTEQQVVLTCEDGRLATAAGDELGSTSRSDPPLLVLTGGNEAWQRLGQPLERGLDKGISEPTDSYVRPYEGTDVPLAAMEAYLQWEAGLVDQLGRDGTHGFRVLDR